MVVVPRAGVPQHSNINGLQKSGKENRPTGFQRFQGHSFPPTGDQNDART